MLTRTKITSFLAAALLSVAALFASPVLATVNMAQSPLFFGGNVPGNLALVPSVEWPTINSMAHLGNYDSANIYMGYFDPGKCYLYSYHATEANRHFYPANTNGPVCTGANEWSGNFLNWAATQTIDPFRSVLTGGYRVRDTATETWLEKARHDGQGGTGVYPNRRLPGAGNDSGMMQGATPFAHNWMRMRIQGLGNRMRFRLQDDGVDTNVTAYNPAVHTAAAIETNRAYEVSIRVKVCDVGVGVEANCRPYDSGWKPEGLIQQYSDRILYSVFGYLNDHNMLRDGGVLRARKKYVGPTMLDPGSGMVDNPNKEWDPNTGVFITNPDPADATATTGVTITNSGVMNYLNKFGQLTSNTHKNFDPVSELLYTALRYFKNQGNVPAYSSMAAAADQATRNQWADGFPVITNWDDPIRYECQANVILGIGDVNTHRDKNLPGSTNSLEEPTMPTEVANDNSVNVVTWTNRVGQSQGLGNIANTNNWSGRNNSAYMAGLAYHANTTDIRPDMPGRQTVSTHWVDVLENQVLQPPAANQYWLTAKYGGFRVPEDFDPATHTGDLPQAWWNANGETLSPGLLRPDNYYTAGGANRMVESLTQAFANIAAEVQQSSASAVATNSTRLDTGTLIYQARFRDDDWTGQLLAYDLDTDGSLNELLWDAAEEIPDNPTARNILTMNNETGAAIEFLWSSLSGSQRTVLNTNRSGIDDGLGEQRLAWVRGDETNEGSLFRERSTKLGSIVNSDPHFVGAQNFGYSALPADDGGSSYLAFRQSKLDTNGSVARPMIYVGANDGMMHGFDASTGEEHFAYMPSAAIAGLSNLTDMGYTHRYLMDGQLFAGDAYLNDQWRTILVGTQGAGGRTVFALDVTDPHNMSTDNVLWEYTHDELGHVLGTPVVGRMRDGTWAAVFGNGYNSVNETARLFVVDLMTGSLIRAIDTEIGSDTNTNGLGAPALLADGTRTLTHAYAGDLHGNLWKFDLSSTDPADWGVAFSGAPLFTAQDASGQPQPITAVPELGQHPDGGYMVYFGTGRYFAVGDNAVDTDNPRPQTFYGIWDNSGTTGASAISYASRDDVLQRQNIIYEGPAVLEGGGSGPFSAVRAVSNNLVTYNPTTGRGWYLDLEVDPIYGGNGFEGERVVSTAILRAGRIIFATLIPLADPCASGGSSWLMELDAVSGARLDYSVFDMDGDGNFNEGDYITIIVDGEEVRVPVSGFRSGVGIIKDPAIVSAGDREYKFASGTSGEVEVVSERGIIQRPRGSWRQIQ